MLEQQIQRAILKRLNSLPNTWCFKTVVSSKNGVPDIIACIDGRFVAIEVKTAKGRLSKIQAYQLDKINKAGGIAFVARSVDELMARLDEHNK